MEQSQQQIQHNVSTQQQPPSTTIDSLQSITEIIKAATPQHSPELCSIALQMECNSPDRKKFKQNHDVPYMQQQQAEMSSQQIRNY